jgi:hypothetical protein
MRIGNAGRHLLSSDAQRHQRGRLPAIRRQLSSPETGMNEFLPKGTLK